MSESPFRELLRRVRAGDEEAAAELVRDYGPEIRRAVRLRLTDPKLRRVFDSADICQSVFGEFFLRFLGGQYDLEGPEHLLRLLGRIARNRVSNRARDQRAARRDHRRLDPAGHEQLADVAAPGVTPSRILAAREALEKVRRLLTAEELYLLEQRQARRDWADIARELGRSPDAVRKQLERALDRVCRELTWDGPGDD